MPVQMTPRAAGGLFLRRAIFAALSCFSLRLLTPRYKSRLLRLADVAEFSYADVQNIG